MDIIRDNEERQETRDRTIAENATCV